MSGLTAERDQQFLRMRDTAREIFTSALGKASIENAFARSVHCERRVLRILDDLHDLDSHNRVFVVSIGKAAHTMPAALEAQLGSSLEAIVAMSLEPARLLQTAHLPDFPYFPSAHPPPPPSSTHPASP